jgi:aminoglycoside/choline kinase family phosphotransferase
MAVPGAVVTTHGDDPSLVAELRTLVRRELGGELVQVEPLRGGVGHRRFFRLRLRGGSTARCVARIDRGEPAPGVLPEPPLEPTRAFLEAHGLPVPKRLGGDPSSNIDLLEDVGSRSLADVASELDVHERMALYREACEWVPKLQRLFDATGSLPAFGRRLDPALLATKAQRFIASSLPAGLGRAPTPGERAVVSAAFAVIADAIAAAPHRLAHRDFQSANLLLRDGDPTPGGARLVLIDLQGAFLAAPEYDLVCLLRDSYVVLEDAEVERLTERVRPTLPDAPSADHFAERFDLLTLARKAKDHALFHEVAARGDPSWLRFVPPTLEYLRQAARRVAPRDVRIARFRDLLETLAPPATQPDPPSNARDAACER